MSTENRASIPGIVKNGVIVPQTDTKLSDGGRVEIILEPQANTPALRAEMEAWDRASDEAWAMIDQCDGDDL